MFLFVLVLVTIFISAVITNHMVDNTYKQHQIVDYIAKGAGELSYLSNDYVIYREDQQLERWYARFKLFANEVNMLKTDKPDQQVLVRNIKENTQRLKNVFDSVVSDMDNLSTNPDINLELLHVSWSRIAVQSLTLTSDASHLSLLIIKQVNRLRTIHITTIFVLIGMFGIYLFLNYLIVQKRALKGIADLQAGTTIIGSGDLDFAIEEKANDEIGDLSRAFNRMTASLKQVTTSKAELERRVKERTAELEQRTKELENFTFIASHDLQEPLRKIRTFGDLLMQKANNLLGDKNREYIKRMREFAARMQTLLQSLLEYSGLTANARPFRPIDLKKSVVDALGNLEILIQEKGAQVEVHNLPSVEADPHQMTQLFQNLIGNALKFQPPGNVPRVKVYAFAEEPTEPGPKIHKIYIEDNGVGFNEEMYLEKIFQPFQRLHGRDEFEGVGIGLSICRKIIEQHGGSLTAKSTPGKGSTFIIKLPETQTAMDIA